jgi:hypothetical protein
MNPRMGALGQGGDSSNEDLRASEQGGNLAPLALEANGNLVLTPEAATVLARLIRAHLDRVRASRHRPGRRLEIDRHLEGRSPT